MPAVNRYYSSVAVDTTLSFSISSTDLSLVVGSTAGFPTSYPYTLAIGYDLSNEELVTIVGASGTTLTIGTTVAGGANIAGRGVDGTNDQAHVAGEAVKHVISARDMTEAQAHIAAESGAHGVTGAIVGTTDLQTLSSKTLASPTITGTITGAVVTSANIVDGTIVNADINASAAIADTKLDTIATAGKVSNSATTATSANTASAIVARDSSGNFSAGTVTANLTGNVTGNATTATSFQTARNINGVSFNGTADITVADSTKLPTAGGTVTGALNVNGGANVTGDITATANVSAILFKTGNMQIVTNTATINGNTAIVVDEFANSGVKAVKYIAHSENNTTSGKYVVEVMGLNVNTTILVSQYGEVNNVTLGTFNLIKTGANLQLTYTDLLANATNTSTVTVLRTLVN